MGKSAWFLLWYLKKNTIEEIIKNDEMLLLEMDVKGALAIKKLYPNKTYSIFVSPPDIGHLRKRFLNVAQIQNIELILDFKDLKKK